MAPLPGASSPRSSRRVASMSPTAPCDNSPAGCPTTPTSPPLPTSAEPTSRTTRCGSPPSPARRRPTLSKNTQRQRLADAPHLLRTNHRVGLARRTGPQPDPRTATSRPDPNRSPSSSTDRDAARFMAAARTIAIARYRLVVEILARTGLRASELCNLAADAVTQSVTPTGSESRSANSATTDSSHCTPTSSPCSPTGPPPTLDHIRTQHRLIADQACNRSTGEPCHRIVLHHRPPSRHRSRPPPPTPPHPRHPSHQPRHAPRSNRRAARSPLPRDDPRLRPHRRQSRR